MKHTGKNIFLLFITLCPVDIMMNNCFHRNQTSFVSFINILNFLKNNTCNELESNFYAKKTANTHFKTFEFILITYIIWFFFCIEKLRRTLSLNDSGK